MLAAAYSPGATMKSRMVSTFLAAGLLAGGVAVPDAAAEGRLTLRLRDAEDGSAAAARVAIRDAEGFLFAAPDPVLRTHETPGTRSFIHMEDERSFDLPEGAYTVFAVRGITGAPVVESVLLEGDLEVTLYVGDWVDPRSSGWYGADPHTHLEHGQGQVYPAADLAHAALVARAEGLDLLYLLENDATSPGGAVAPAWPGTTLVWGEEFRNGFWGHVAILGLGSLLTWEGGAGCCGDDDAAWPTLTEALASAPGAVRILAHPHSTDTPGASFLGWPGAGFARERAALALGDHVEGFAVASGSNTGNLWALPAYLDGLRVGARWAAVGETDAALDRFYLDPPGQPRTFAKLDGSFAPGDPLLVGAWEQALRERRTFASTGPVIHEFAAGGATTGEEVVLAGPATVTVSFTVEAATALARVTLHGATGVHEEFLPPAGAKSFSSSVDLPLAHDDFVLLEVEATPTAWPHAHEAPRAVSSPIWVRAGLPWPVAAELPRAAIVELGEFWALGLADRGFDSAADSSAARTDILGAAAVHESMVDDLPGPFDLLSPIPFESVASLPLTLSWSRSASHDLEPKSYRVEVATDASFASPILEVVVADTFTTVDGPLAPAVYSWRVTALEPENEEVAALGGAREFWFTGGVVGAPAYPPTRAFFSGPRRAGGGYRFTLNLQDHQRVHARWIDVRGREAGRREFGTLPAGEHHLHFDAGDGRGSVLPRGVYWLVVEAGDRRAAARIVWTR